MTSRGTVAHQNYPAKYFSEAPTYWRWNALTAHDVHHTLQARSGFEGQNLYFVLNHPIKFVRLVGLVVDMNLLGNGKYLVLTLDDGSRSTIECKAEVRQQSKLDEASGRKRVVEEWPSTTLIDNLDVLVHFGTPKIEVDKQAVDIGTVIKAKGTIDTFRQQRQLKLERISIVSDTNEEAKAWRETAEWKAGVLATPWVLTDKQRAEVDAKLAGERIKEREREKKRRVKDKVLAEKKLRHDEKREKKRRILEGEFDKGALVRSGILPERVTDS